MIKMFLVRETDNSVVYNYYVDKDIEQNRGTVEIFKDSLEHQILKQDASGWENMWAHVKRLVLEGLKGGEFKKEGVAAWY